jgi:hypothetical protein
MHKAGETGLAGGSLLFIHSWSLSNCGLHPPHSDASVGVERSGGYSHHTQMGTLRWEHSDGNTQMGTFREHSGNIQGTCGDYSGNMWGTFREHAGNIQGTRGEHSARCDSHSDGAVGVKGRIFPAHDL